MILFLFSLALSSIIHIESPQFIIEYKLGDIAERNIKAPVDFIVQGTDVAVKKGEIIVREGERITEDHLEKLAAVNALDKRDTLTAKKAILFFILIFVLITIIFEYASRNIKKFSLSEKDLIFSTVFTVFTVLVVKVLFVIFDLFAPAHVNTLFYIIPMFVFGIVFRVVLFSEASIIFSAMFSITLGFAFGNSLMVFLYVFTGNLLSSYFAGKSESRNTVLKAGLYTSCIMAFLVVVFDALLNRQLLAIPTKITFVILSGIASSFVALGLLPVIESIFGYTTDIKLLELANLENPLLEEMMINAPGTYHHSIVVGNLAKAAAEAIGAHPLLTRVAAYYHDIGKLKMPHYFIENRVGTDDAHAALTPNMSALVILSHTKEGVELAEANKIGAKITDIIKQHHGTSLVSYFYNKAKEQEDPALHVIEEKDFRYAGPRPQTKEAGIIMLADAVEAASRVLEDPTPKRIESHVQQIVENIFIDGQLDDCELTLKDLHAIQKSFVAILIGIFHQRIEYPERTTHGGTDKKLTTPVEDKHKEGKGRHHGLARLFRT